VMLISLMPWVLLGLLGFSTQGLLWVGGFEDSLDHFRAKILRLKDLMYFSYSRRVAEVLTDRILEYLRWWGEELG
jgi:hypothetical protein